MLQNGGLREFFSVASVRDGWSKPTSPGSRLLSMTQPSLKTVPEAIHFAFKLIKSFFKPWTFTLCTFSNKVYRGIIYIQYGTLDT